MIIYITPFKRTTAHLSHFPHFRIMSSNKTKKSACAPTSGGAGKAKKRTPEDDPARKKARKAGIARLLSEKALDDLIKDTIAGGCATDGAIRPRDPPKRFQDHVWVPGSSRSGKLIDGYDRRYNGNDDDNTDDDHVSDDDGDDPNWKP